MIFKNLFGKNKTAEIEFGEQQKRELVGLIWCLTQSDLSNHIAILQSPADEQHSIMTTEDSGHFKFCNWLAQYNLLKMDVVDMPEIKAIKPASFSYTPQCKDLLSQAIPTALNTGHPPQGCIISNTALSILEINKSQGKHEAYKKFGELYLSGQGVEKNIQSAEACFLKAIELGNSQSANNLGFLYFAEIKDIEKAIKYFSIAAEDGNTTAMDNLSEIYNRGIGVEQNPEKAIHWLRKAAEHGHNIAMCKLADCYANGKIGDVDLEQAYFWFALGIKHGTGGAEENFKAVKDQLSEDQINKMNEQLQKWTPQTV